MSTAEAIRPTFGTVPDETRTLGWQVLAWTRAYLLTPDGPDAGTPWVFTKEQARLVLRWYEIDSTGRFVYRRGVIRRCKGWGKDPLLAAIAAVELCGPCRFGGWDAEGRPVAVDHPSPWIPVAAVSRDQTNNTMRLFAGMFTNAAVDEYRIDLGRTIIYARGVGQIEAVTSSPRALEGKRPSLTILNESQEWLKSNDGHAMAEATRRNSAKASDGAARTVEICNAHLPGEDSVAERTFEAWRLADGDVPGLMYDSLEAPPVEDLRDREAVRAALLAARGDSRWLDVDRLAAEIADPVTPEHISRRYYLNQVVAVDAERWIPPGPWDACVEEPGRDIPDGEDVVLAFDGSFSGDSTGVVAATVGAEPHLTVVDCWESEGPGWRVPIEDVEDAIREACRRWHVVELVADPYRWARSLQLLDAERIPVVEYPQSRERMIPATTRFYEAVMNGKLSHSGDERLSRHVSNAVLRVSSRGGQLTKDSKDSPRRIDLAVCAVMAFARAVEYKSGIPRVW